MILSHNDSRPLNISSNSELMDALKFELSYSYTWHDICATGTRYDVDRRINAIIFAMAC